MTLSDINSKIDQLTGDVGSVAYTAAQRLIDINIYLHKIVGMILESQDDLDWDDTSRTNYPVANILLTTNRDYQIDSSLSLLKIKSVSIAYDGVNFYRATPLDMNENDIGQGRISDTTQNTTIDGNFSRTSPRYDIKFNSIFLYPLATAADVTAGGRMVIEYWRSPVEYTSSDLSNGTKTPPFDATFHVMLAFGPAYEYTKFRKDPDQAKTLLQDLQDYENRLRRQYSSKDQDRKYALVSDYQSYK